MRRGHTRARRDRVGEAASDRAVDPVSELDPGASTAPPHLLGAGTGMRFVLLLVLVAASTIAMMSDHIVLRRFLGDPNNDTLGCQLAAGYDPGAPWWQNFTALSGGNGAAFTRCASWRRRQDARQPADTTRASGPGK
jgi:hypothetical protein